MMFFEQSWKAVGRSGRESLRRMRLRALFHARPPGYQDQRRKPNGRPREQKWQCIFLLSVCIMYYAILTTEPLQDLLAEVTAALGDGKLFRH